MGEGEKEHSVNDYISRFRPRRSRVRRPPVRVSMQPTGYCAVVSPCVLLSSGATNTHRELFVGIIAGQMTRDR